MFESFSAKFGLTVNRKFYRISSGVIVEWIETYDEFKCNVYFSFEGVFVAVPTNEVCSHCFCCLIYFQLSEW